MDSHAPLPLHHRVRGDGEPVILLHGLFGSASNLGAIERTLVDRFKVISADMRNHGRSPWGPRMDYPAMAGDVLALMDRLSLPRAHIFGHSMGGKTAMQLALMAPDRVNRIVVGDISPLPYPDGHAATLKGYAALMEAAPQSQAEADAVFAPFEPDPATRAFLLTNWTRGADGKLGLRVNLDAITANYAAIRGAITGDPHKGLVLFLKGEHSPYIEPSHGDEIRRLFPAADLKIIGGAGHWIHADKPELTARLTLRFLE